MQEQETTKATGPHAPKDFLSNIMRGDAWIWTIYIFLFCLSAVEIFSATSQLTYKSAYVSDPAFSHIRHLFFGLVAVLVTQSMSVRSMQAWGKILWFGGVCLAFATIFFGVVQKGAARSIGGLQPVEFCKLGIVMVLCSAITARDASYHVYSFFRTHTSGRRFWFYLFLIFLVAFPIATQNLSSALIMGMASLGIMFLGRVNGKYLWQMIGVGVVAGLLFLGGLKAVYESNKGVGDLENIETVENATTADSGSKLFGRVVTWSRRIFSESSKPLYEEDIHGKKSQEIYSRMALVNGYPFGKFIGNSKMRDFLPEAFSDYIFAIIFEEWGPFGALLVILLYLALFYRCYMLSRQTQNIYVRLMMIGIPLIIVIQALMHIGVCTGAMFVTGQPLPLISRGGTSIMGTSISFGIILALSRIIKQEQDERQQQELEAAKELAEAETADVAVPDTDEENTDNEYEPAEVPVETFVAQETDNNQNPESYPI